MAKKIVHVPWHKQLNSTPAAPDPGFSKIYAKTDLEWYGLDEFGTEVQLSGGASGTGNIGHYVYRPGGGLTSGIVYEDFSDLMVDLEAWEGSKYLWFDRSGLPALTNIEIPVGIDEWDFSDTTFHTLTSGISPTLTIDVADGNTWANFPVAIFLCALTFNNTANPVYTQTSGVELVALNDGSSINNNGIFEAIRLEGTANFVMAIRYSDIIADNYEVFNLEDTSTLNINLLQGGDLAADSIRGVIGTTVEMNIQSPLSLVDENQTSFLGNFIRGYGPISVVFDDTLPNLGTVNLGHYLETYQLSVEVWHDTTGLGTAFRKLGDSSISVDMPDSDNVLLTDNIGLGGIPVKVIIQKHKDQITY